MPVTMVAKSVINQSNLKEKARDLREARVKDVQAKQYIACEQAPRNFPKPAQSAGPTAKKIWEACSQAKQYSKPIKSQSMSCARKARENWLMPNLNRLVHSSDSFVPIG